MGRRPQNICLGRAAGRGCCRFAPAQTVAVQLSTTVYASRALHRSASGGGLSLMQSRRCGVDAHARLRRLVLTVRTKSPLGATFFDFAFGCHGSTNFPPEWAVARARIPAGGGCSIKAALPRWVPALRREI